MDKHIKWIFTLPAVIFVSIMMAYPLIYTFRISFYEWSMSSVSAPKWVGLNNYTSLLQDERFWDSLWITFYYTSASLFIEMILGVGIALLFFRGFKWDQGAKTVLMLPMVATPVAISMVWMLIYEPTMGIANRFITALGFEPLEWLGSTSQVIPSLIIIDVWQWTPMIAILVIAGLTTLPQDPYESAAIDGASALQKLMYITLPLLRPTIIVALVLRLVELLKQFDVIYSTTMGGPASASETMNLLSYITAFEYFKMGSASALLMMFFVLVIGLILLLLWIRKRLGVQL
ncbi:carbohydrate ABC transporter permease [Radiobacillus sp. PE A8.2]|uniref:carbohydrate ABC transporter permease n=1 Tax=Radiobacillus sp. PE A8.2 TaxID=3380349 RepID=UPI00388EBAD8